MYRYAKRLPKVGDLVRSGMGSRIGRVVGVLDVTQVTYQPLGSVLKGVWVPSKGRNSYTVLVSDGRWGLHCVEAVNPPEGAPR